MIAGRRVTPKEFIAKGLLWAYIRVKGLELLMGGYGHSVYICHLEPWEPPDRGPWEGVCSPKVCHQYNECLGMVAHWTQAQELVDDLDLDEEGADS